MRIAVCFVAILWMSTMGLLAQQPEAASDGERQSDRQATDTVQRPRLENSVTFKSSNSDSTTLSEFQRIDQELPGRSDIRLEILRLQNKLGQYEQGIKTFEAWKYPSTDMPSDLRRKYIGMCFQGREIDRVRSGMRFGLGLKEPERTQVELHLALYDRDHDAARKLFERFEIQHIYRIKDAYTPAMRALDAYRPHPVWAGALLSLVPGGGLFYNRRYGAGVATMFVVGGSCLAALAFSRQGEDGRRAATAFATLAGSLFAVNIGLGAITSKKYNAHLEQSYLRRLDRLTARIY